MNAEKTDRRTVLKGIGAGVVGSAAFVGGVSAGESRHGHQESFAWANDTLYEMLDSEPPAIEAQEIPPGRADSEGNSNSHRPLWLVGSMDDYSNADQVDGTEHSPHPNPLGVRVDHVVPIGGGGEFTAQWHVHLLLRNRSEVEELLSIAESGDQQALVNFLNQLPHGDGQGNIVTSADTIRAAVNRGDRVSFPLFFENEQGEVKPDVFTCPVRPHHH